MRFLFVGAGALGGYVGGSLALAGHAVAFLARPQTALGLRSHGLRITDARSGAARRVPAFDVASESAGIQAHAPYDCVVFTTKAYDTLAAAKSLQMALAQPPPILCLQNGVDGEDELNSIFGPNSAIAGTVTTPISRSGAGELVIEKSRGLGIALGHPLSGPLLDSLNRAGIVAKGYPSAHSMKWSKLMTNLVGNATSAILDMRVEEIFNSRDLFSLEMRSLRECLAVMRALHCAVVDLPGVPVRALSFAAGLPAWLARPLLRRGVGAGRGGKMPSLHLDLHSGRPNTEVNWLHGAVARHGRLAGVATPVNTFLTETLLALSAGQLDLGPFRHNPSSLLSRLSI